uniref:Uncharacterized protein n=1 Tax=Arundo donax TaxID=35708 RepID=A0A0A9E9H1_ARUDO
MSFASQREKASSAITNTSSASLYISFFIRVLAF